MNIACAGCHSSPRRASRDRAASGARLRPAPVDPDDPSAQTAPRRSAARCSSREAGALAGLRERRRASSRPQHDLAAGERRHDAAARRVRRLPHAVAHRRNERRLALSGRRGRAGTHLAQVFSRRAAQVACLQRARRRGEQRQGAADCGAGEHRHLRCGKCGRRRRVRVVGGGRGRLSVQGVRRRGRRDGTQITSSACSVASFGECHRPSGSQPPDLGTVDKAYDALVGKQSDACDKPYVVRTMPLGRSSTSWSRQTPSCSDAYAAHRQPDSAEIKLIADWINGGALRDRDLEKRRAPEALQSTRSTPASN